MLIEGSLSSRAAKDLLSLIAKEGDSDPQDLAKTHNLIQDSSQSNLEAIVLEVISANARTVEEYKAGKATAIEYLLGQCMKKTRGAANPTVLRGVLQSKLDS